MPHYWLMKSEPGEYSFEDLMRDGRTVWDGVRNHQAKKNLAAMAVGDQALIYHSVSDKEVVGIGEITRSAYPDPTDNPTGTWVVVDVAPVRPLKRRVSLHTIKTTPELADIPLVRQSRLSVMPLTQEVFEKIIALGEGRIQI